MAFPLVPIAAALAAGFGLRWLWDKAHPGASNLMASLPGGTPAQQVANLTPGQAYFIDMLIDPTGFASKDPQNNAQQISSALQGVGIDGTSIGPPEPRDATQTAAFQANQPSRWFMMFRWAGPGSVPGAVPGFVKQFNFYPVPASV